MKTFLFTMFALCTSMMMAIPSIAYVETSFTFDETKVSGLPSAGTLVTKDFKAIGVALKTLAGKPGEEAQCLIVIDDPEGLKSIEVESVVVHQNRAKCPLSFSSLCAFKEGNLSHLLLITAKIPEESVLVEYTLKVNGGSIKLPLYLHVKE